LIRLIPQSLLWRTFLLIALLLGLSVTAWLQIFRLYEREPRSVQIADQIAAIVNLTRAALVSSKPESRAYLLGEISESERIEIYPVETNETLEPLPQRPVIRRIEELLRAKIGDNTRFASSRNSLPGVWVSFHIDDDEYWVRLRGDRIDPNPPLQWVGWGVASLLLALIGAYFIVWTVNRPLKELTAAARAVGRGERAAAVPEQGAAEIRALASAFNQMANDLKTAEVNRTLILAGISHDLRTPLARLRLGVEMSADPTFSEGMVSDIEQIDGIIGQFLEFARSGQDEAAPAGDVDLTGLAAEIRAHYESHGRAPALEADADPVVARGRRPALRRALHNLIDNALRYSADAAGDADITLRVARAGKWAQVDVLDRGPGIPAAEAERLKQPFTRLDVARGTADGSESGAQGGSGLGLAIVDRIAHQHGGSFDLLSRPGGGLIARLSLPLEAATH
jgi:two-component system osmolarity sensor histidine kinase EnvZ